MRVVREIVAELLTPKSIKAISNKIGEKYVKECLKPRRCRLSAKERGYVWAELGFPAITASYLRRSIMRPKTKKELMRKAEEKGKMWDN